MKQLKHLVLYLPFVLAAVGCSQDELTDTTGGGETGKVREVPITLSLGVNAGLQLSSRSVNTPTNYVARAGENTPRELTSWDPAQQVNDMRIYVFRSDSQDGPYTYYRGVNSELPEYYSVSEFCNTTPHTGPFEEHTYTFKPSLKDGYYKFLAVGRDDKDATLFEDATNEFSWGYKVLEEPDMKGKNFDTSDISVLNISMADNQPLWCTEIFSGIMLNTDGSEKYLCVDNTTKGFSGTIELKRAVAGLMMYVKNIPASVTDNSGGRYDGKDFTPTEIGIYISYGATSFNLKERCAITSETNSNYGESNPLVAYADLVAWTEKDGILVDESGNNAVMSSNFIMPTALENLQNSENEFNEATFYLVYAKGQGTASRRRVEKIRIKSAINPNDPTDKPVVPEGYIFPIEANYLYSLGQKDSNIDEPYDLSQGGEGNEIVIKVSPDWQWEGNLEWQ